jgi:hypothetical protein
MDIGFAFDHDSARAQAPGDFAREIDGGRIVAMQIAAQPPFDDGATANDAAAGQVAFGGQMHVAAGPNGTAEAAGDFIIAQINVRAAPGANRGGRRAGDLLFAFAFETFDQKAALPFPKIFKLAQD